MKHAFMRWNDLPLSSLLLMDRYGVARACSQGMKSISRGADPDTEGACASARRSAPPAGPKPTRLRPLPRRCLFWTAGSTAAAARAAGRARAAPAAHALQDALDVHKGALQQPLPVVSHPFPYHKPHTTQKRIVALALAYSASMRKCSSSQSAMIYYNIIGLHTHNT